MTQRWPSGSGIPQGMEQGYGYPPGGTPFGGPPGGLGGPGLGSGSGGPPAAPAPSGDRASGRVLDVYEVFKATELWTQPQKTLTFGPSANPYADPFAPVGQIQAIFETPLFDLRHDIHDQNAYAGNTLPIGKNTLYGDQLWMHVQLFNFTAAQQLIGIASNLRWYVLEKAAVVNPSDVRFYGTRLEITADMYAANPTTGNQLIRLRPIGHVRYWGAAIIAETPGFVGALTQPLMMAGSLH